MRKLVVCGMGLIAALSARSTIAQDLVAKTEAKSPAEEHKTFKLPPGFEIQLVAADPDINKPMNLAFDAKGRLWVTSTVEYPYPAKEGTTPRDRVIVLSDFADDGRAKKVETFATGLNIPIGLLPIEKGVIVYGIDHIRKFIDNDGDGKADVEENVMGTIGHRDTHGMTSHFTVGFDGWVYANHGFNNDSEVVGKDGSSIKMNSGNCYRFKLDGSHVEYVAHGQVNPFGLAFDPLGNLYSADCHTRPQYMLLRGAFYPSFGKPDDGLGYAPEMCTHDHGSTAISGTVYYAAEQFPPEYRGTLFNGNPVTNKIDHDSIKWRGSSPVAVERPDFVSSSDPWFRPVDIVTGPDGAMYVADFYNRIIGHYEVPLDHPGRDRTSGRIWRIVYRGEKGDVVLPKVPDLSTASADELVATLASPNFVLRRMAQRQLVERVGTSATPVVQSALVKPANPQQLTHLLWTAQLLGGLTPANLEAAAKNSDASVRVHAMRILSESPKLANGQDELIRKSLGDTDPNVRRAASDAVGQHPAIENVKPLLKLIQTSPKEDTHLIHVARMALRNQLEDTATMAAMPKLELNLDEQRGVADVVIAVTNPDVGGLVMKYLNAGITDPAKTVQLLIHAARRLPPSDVDSIAQTVVERFPKDLDFQRQLFVAVLEGLAQRGAQPGDATRHWGIELAKQLVVAEPFDNGAWTFVQMPGSSDTTNPWTTQQRPIGQDGAPALWSSHPRGEKLTGILRSRPFVIPKRLSFLIAGHYGVPSANEPSKSFVRLKLVDGDKVVVASVPPKNDTPKKIEWDLSRWEGQKGYIEGVDADARDAFAWIAFGQFEPAVAPTPAGMERTRDRIVAASMIAKVLKLAEMRERMEQILDDPFADPQARAGAASALSVMGTNDSVKVMAKAVADPKVPPAVREAISQSLADQSSPAAREALLSAIAVAPEPLQRGMAVAIAVNREGGEALLGAVAAGKASPRLLQDPKVAERLKAAGIPDLDQRLATLTKGLIPADEAINELLKKRRAEFDPTTASVQRGAEVFAKNCAACHRIGEVGAIVGPQLDGVGKRGVDRIIEDVLDPNRNVDGAFRTSIIQLKTGQTVSGLLRREEGELIVLADSTGKELSVEKSKVKRRVQSVLSLMPGNFGEAIPPAEFYDLLAFLASK